jgi:hypothetical protein
MIATEKIAKRRRAESAIRVFRENSEARQHQQQPAERGGVSFGFGGLHELIVDRLRELSGSLGRLRNEVCDAEFCGDIDRLRFPEACDHLEQLG